MVINKRTLSLQPLLIEELRRQPQLGDLPTDFLLRWIQKESGGNFAVVSSLGERGLFQVMRGTAQDHGWSEQTFLATSRDSQQSMRLGLETITWLRRTTDKKLAAVGLDRSVNGYYAFLKLAHGLPILQTYLTQGFTRAHGRPPTGWSEAAAWARRTASTRPVPGGLVDVRGKSWAGAVHRLLTNAESVAFGSGSSPTQGTNRYDDLIALVSSSHRPTLARGSDRFDVGTVINRIGG